MEASDFERALREKIRFRSTKGYLTLEDLWDVPLRSRRGGLADFNLDVIARNAKKDLDDLSVDSFVETNENSAAAKTAALRLDLVKHVIKIKLGEEAEAKRRADNRKRREKLLEVLERKQESLLEGMSEEDIKKELEALS